MVQPPSQNHKACDWAHFTQNGADLAASFQALGIAERLRLIEPGVATTIALS